MRVSRCVLVATLLALPVSCAERDPEGIAGTWQGEGGTLTLSSDGTFRTTLLDREVHGTYQWTGERLELRFEEEAFRSPVAGTGELRDDTLLFRRDGQAITYRRVGKAR